MSSAAKTVAFSAFQQIRNERRMLAEFLKAADRFDRKHARSKEAASAQLQREGIITKSGRLTKRYGG